MNALRAMVQAAVAAAGLAGCAVTSMHYNWAYTPLHDVESEAFQPPAGGIEWKGLSRNAYAPTYSAARASSKVR